MQTKTRTNARTSLRIRETPNQERRYLGVDLHWDSFLVCVRDEGEVRMQRWSLDQVQEFAGTLRPQDELAVEATGNTRWFCQQVAARVRRIVVVNPQQFRVISESVNKTDRRDAALLAEYLEKDLLPEVRRKSALESELAQMAQARDQLVKMRSMLKNQLHGLFASYGVALPKKALASHRQRTALHGRSLSPLADVQQRVLLGQIEAFDAGIAELERALTEAARSLPGYAHLISVKGIGPLGATILLSAIRTDRRLCRAGQTGGVLRTGAARGAVQPNRASRAHHATRQQTGSHHPGPVRPRRPTLQPPPAEIL